MRNKVFSFINIVGLALGIAAFAFILQYISFEQSVNQFHANLPQLYRLLAETQNEGKTIYYPNVPPGLAAIAKNQFGEIKATCRVTEGIARGIVKYDNNTNNIQSFREDNLAYVDGNFFEVFSFPVKQGNANALKKPDCVVISERYAQKYFGQESPLGKVITLYNQFGEHNYTVSAIYQDFPNNSDIKFDMLFSLQTLANPANLNENGWAALDNLDSEYLTTYLQLEEQANPQQLERKFNDFKKKLKPQWEKVFHLQPLSSIHLGQSLDDPYTTSGNLSFVYLLGGVAMLILLIAWFNYVNLSTVGSLKRAKEVGVRKVIGASRGQLIKQFLGESLLLNAGGFILALAMIELFQRPFNELIGKELSLSSIGQGYFWLLGICLLIIGALASGSYTAFALSGFKPTETLKGVFTKSGKGAWLQKSLVVFQFSISIALIATTLVLYRQLQFMQTQELGMNLEQVLVIKGAEIGRDSSFKSRNGSYKNALSQLSYVKTLATSNTVPSNWYNFQTDGITKLSPKPDDDKKNYNIAIIGERYFDTYGIRLVAGQGFVIADCERKWNDVNKLVLNETAIAQMGFASAQAAVGQRIKWGDDKTYELIGVVKDYHHGGLKEAIQPIIFFPQTGSVFYSLRLTTDQVQSKMGELERLYKQSFPGNPFEYFFANEQYNRQYQTEQQYGRIFTTASLLAIFIACLGLFGLAAFTAEQRTKEIGVRKVLGASIRSIVGLLSKDFLKLVFIAFVIAIPIVWYFMHKWLQDFAYRTDLSWWIFGGAGMLAMLIAFFTVSFQAIRTALTNPVKALRAE